MQLRCGYVSDWAAVKVLVIQLMNNQVEQQNWYDIKYDNGECFGFSDGRDK